MLKGSSEEVVENLEDDGDSTSGMGDTALTARG